MTVNLAELHVDHVPEKQRFEINAGDYVAVLTYTLQNRTITFLHVGVPPELESHGFGTKLVMAGLEYAHANGLKIKSLCWFVDRFLIRHPEDDN